MSDQARSDGLIFSDHDQKPPRKDPWTSLPLSNSIDSNLEPGESIKALSAIALVPVALATFYGLLPARAQLGFHDLTNLILVAAAFGGIFFFLCLGAYRIWRQRQQLRLNADFASRAPENFVLYLRSFRRTGTVFVENHLPGLADRRLLGNYWDVELALTTCIREKFCVVAVGAKSSSLGAAKLTSRDESWKDLVETLSISAKAIFIIPDDRPGTLWELKRILGDPALRKKTILMMPPEQFGWRRRLRRLPTIRRSWEAVTQTLASSGIALPNYSQTGAFLQMGEFDGQERQLEFNRFSPERVRYVVATSVIGNCAQIEDISLHRAYGGTAKEGWQAYVDAVWPVVFICASISFMAIGELHDFNEFLTAFFLAVIASLVVNTYAFTKP